MDLLSGLNPAQRAAVMHGEGPLLILAGAGSGKTRVVTHRIASLIRDRGVYPEAILAVTFTNKAAGEMKDRVTSLLPDSPPGRGPRVFTFHSFCVRLLRRDGGPLASFRPGFTRQFLIYDDDDQLSVVKSLFREHAIDDKALPPRNVLAAISRAKNQGEDPDDLMRRARDPISRQTAGLYRQYDEALLAANALDFDDLLLESVRLLNNDRATRDRWRSSLEYLMIDEYQDTNRSQYDLMRLLASERNNVCAVGDEDQSIYSWRGADIRNILDFERDFPNAAVIRLEQNYRSTGTILDAAGAVIANNTERKGKTLWTESGRGAKVVVYCAPDGEAEGLFIADTVQRLLREDRAANVAVLYRTNAQSRQIEEAMRRYRLPYRIVGGLSFYQRAEIKDAMAYLKLLFTPSDSVSLLRVINTPARGIGRTTIEQIEQFARSQKCNLWSGIERIMEARLLPARAEAAVGAFRRLIEDLSVDAASAPIHSLLTNVLHRTSYRAMIEADRSPGAENRIENLNELLNAAAEANERGDSVADFLDHAALVADADGVDERAPISMLTVHNAKGLEFTVVFLAGLEERLFPHSRSIDSPSGMEEERRLCYVGMTRAQRRLYVTHALARRRYGGGPMEPAMRSRFIAEIPAELCEFHGAAPGDDELFQDEGEVDLYAERQFVRETARWSSERFRPRDPAPPAAPAVPYQGKTYNSKENIAQFFRDRGLPLRDSPPRGGSPAPVIPMPERGASAPPAAAPARQAGPAPGARKRKFGQGSEVNHPKYGRGTVMRMEGTGEDAKLTILFPGHGMKKIIAKFAGIRIDE